MNPLPAPHVPGKTDFERFDHAVRKVFAMSKDAVAKAAPKHAKATKRTKRG